MASKLLNQNQSYLGRQGEKTKTQKYTIFLIKLNGLLSDLTAIKTSSYQVKPNS
jgi:hypothetical protein